VKKFTMNRKLSMEERVLVLQKWCQHDHSYRDVVDLFVERFPNGVPPSRQAIHNLNKRFEQTGSVEDRPRSGRPKSATTEENLNIVAQS
jgi:transposase